MFVFFRVAFVVGAFSALSFAALADDALPSNAGFEDGQEGQAPAGWNADSNIYKLDASSAHSGKSSLHYVNSDPAKYLLCSQGLKLEKGRMYDVSVWVKTRGVEGADTGASICLEWHSDKGQFLGGFYPAGVKGDSDWKLVTGKTERIPEDAAGISVSCYLRQRMSGEAWWDDIEVKLAKQDPLEVILATPNYRKNIPDGGAENAVVRASIDLIDYVMTAQDVVLKWTLRRSGEAVTDGRCDALVKGRNDIEIPVAELPHGDYEIEVRLEPRTGGDPLSVKNLLFSRTAKLSAGTSFIDEHNRLIVNGKPFFPLGMYWGQVDAPQLDVYADSPFNCLMPYGAPDKNGMDLCEKKGLKVIYSVKDIYSGMASCPPSIKTEADEEVFVKGKTEAFRDHPALLAWYVNDELGAEYMPRLAARRALMEKLDPGHPTWAVLYQVDEISDYIETFDAIGTDPYPIPAGPVSKAGDWTKRTNDGVMGARPVWMVPQVFNWACYKDSDEERKSSRPPTYEEMRSMTWQCVVNGAHGLIFYSWFDLYRDPATPFETQWGLVKKVAKEVADYFPALLSIENVPEIVPTDASGLQNLVRKVEGKTYLFVVNPDSEPHSGMFKFPKTPDSLTANGAQLALEDGCLRVELKAYDVMIVESTGF
jgi:hypothetical protein